MKILHISALSHAGAGHCAISLHQNLLNSGADSRMLVYGDGFENERTEVPQIYFTNGCKNIIQRKIQKACRRMIPRKKVVNDERSRDYGTFSYSWKIQGLENHYLVREADMVHLHWIGDMFNPVQFVGAISPKPVIWTVHDYNPITGGCHVPYECSRFEKLCGECPYLVEAHDQDISRRLMLDKKEIYPNSNLTFVAPSRMLYDALSRTQIAKKVSKEIIPHGIDTSIFKPLDKMDCRKRLNIPKDQTLLMWVSAYKSLNKGFDLLIRVLEILSKKSTGNIGIILVGPYGKNEIGRSRLPIYEMGFVTDVRRLAEIYNAADLTLITSRQETFCMTAAESVACGTPIIGFKTGILAQLQEAEKAGFFFDISDISKMITALCGLLLENRNSLNHLRDGCAEYMANEYNEVLWAKRYRDLYNNLQIHTDISEENAR